MRTFTNGTKLKVQDKFFTLTDLREKSTMWQDDTSYFGSSRNYCLQSHYSESDIAEKKAWDDSVELNNGDQIWIDGKSYILVVTDIKASNGLMFITSETYSYIKTMQNTQD